jgi:WD40 repeat protein
MDTSPKILTERSTANRNGWRSDVLNTNSLSRISAATNWVRARCANQASGAASALRWWSWPRTTGGLTPLRLPEGQFQVLVLVVCSFFSGCGPSKPAAPTLVPREVKSNVERLSLVRFSPDGQQLAAGSANGDVLIWGNVGDPPIKLESGHSSPLLSLTWSSDGLVTATDLNRGLVGWQFNRPEPTRVELPGLPSAAICLAFRPNTKSLEFVLGMRDGSLFFVDGSGSKQLKPDHRGPVKQVLYSLDGKSLVTAGADGQLIWRDASTRGIAQAVKAHGSEISRLLLSADGKQLISGDWNGAFKIWDMTTRQSQREFHQPEAVCGLGWIGKELVSASWDGSLRGWDVSSGSCLHTFATGQPIHDLSCDARTPRVATVSLDRMVRVWDWPDSAAR